MQTSQKTKGEEVLEVKSKTVTTTVKDISPSGVTIELNSDSLVKGKFSDQGSATTTPPASAVRTPLAAPLLSLEAAATVPEQAPDTAHRAITLACGSSRGFSSRWP